MYIIHTQGGGGEGREYNFPHCQKLAATLSGGDSKSSESRAGEMKAQPLESLSPSWEALTEERCLKKHQVVDDSSVRALDETR